MVGKESIPVNDGVQHLLLLSSAVLSNSLHLLGPKLKPTIMLDGDECGQEDKYDI